MGYPGGSNSSVKPGYQPVTSANDPRLSYTSSGTISNPLNIRPSRLPPPQPNKLNARASSPRPGPKKKVVVGSGWPYNKQANGTNGHAAAVSTISVSPPVARNPLPVVRPLTPESTRSSTTPPGLSGLAPYSSPSPPGFLHSSSAPKSTAPVDQGRYGLFSSSVASTPQIKHGESLVMVTLDLVFYNHVQKPTIGEVRRCCSLLLVPRHNISPFKHLDLSFPHPQLPPSSDTHLHHMGQ